LSERTVGIWEATDKMVALFDKRLNHQEALINGILERV
jgi:hypothetical protein